MVKIGEKTVDMVNWEYIKEKDEYSIIFKISGLDSQIRERIIKKQKSGFLKSQGINITEIIEVKDYLHVKEHYRNKDIKMYKSLIPLVQKGIIPERLDPEKIEIEEDLCMLEQDMKFRIDHAGKSVDELKEHYKELIESLEKLKEEYNSYTEE